MDGSIRYPGFRENSTRNILDSNTEQNLCFRFENREVQSFEISPVVQNQDFLWSKRIYQCRNAQNVIKNTTKNCVGSILGLRHRCNPSLCFEIITKMCLVKGKTYIYQKIYTLFTIIDLFKMSPKTQRICVYLKSGETDTSAYGYFHKHCFEHPNTSFNYWKTPKL